MWTMIACFSMIVVIYALLFVVLRLRRQLYIASAMLLLMQRRLSMMGIRSYAMVDGDDVSVAFLNEYEYREPYGNTEFAADA